MQEGVRKCFCSETKGRRRQERYVHCLVGSPRQREPTAGRLGLQEPVRTQQEIRATIGTIATIDQIAKIPTNPIDQIAKIPTIPKTVNILMKIQARRVTVSSCVRISTPRVGNRLLLRHHNVQASFGSVMSS